jgi:hypothetical protein
MKGAGHYDAGYPDKPGYRQWDPALRREDHTGDADQGPCHHDHRDTMTSPAAPTPASGLTLGELRHELVALLALADTAEKPAPSRVHPSDHPMPGHEWSVKAHMPKVVHDHYYRRDRDGWLIRAAEESELADCIFVSTPDAMDAEDFMAVPIASARQLGMAILAACDRADSVRLGVPRLESWRTRQTSPNKGDQVT